MTIETMQKIMIEKGITIRAIPMEVISFWTAQEKDMGRDGVFFDGKRYLEKKVKYPENGGKFIIQSNCGNDSQVRFIKPVYYDTIEEAINSLL